MTLTSLPSYEFGGFTLNTNERVLLYLNERLQLTGKDFDILLFLVRHPKQLVTNVNLLAGVWGEGSVLVERGLNNYIARIRGVLGCDSRSPTFIETVRGKGYRFIADVRVSENDVPPPISTKTESRDEYLITSHLFVPVFLGSEVFEDYQGELKESPWLFYREILVAGGRLCVLPNGFSVWHITNTMRFKSASVIARWRRQIYNEILQRRHRFTKDLDNLLRDIRLKRGTLFLDKKGIPGYVLSAMFLESPRWLNIDRLKNALLLLSFLTSLESPLNRKKEEGIAFERRVLEDGFLDSEIREFGVRRQAIGFASWDGVSYFNFDINSPGIAKDLIEFEIAVQAIWWFAKCLSEEMMIHGRSSKGRIGEQIEALNEMYTRVQSIGSRETPAQRTMIEAILHTSRVERLVRETIRQYEGR